jgi:DNA-binding LacI/PurR family transcriptional regulator
VIGTSDLIAYGAARAWREAEPIETAPRMIGFDASPMNEWLVPALSSIRIPYDAFSHAIVAALDGPDKHARNGREPRTLPQEYPFIDMPLCCTFEHLVSVSVLWWSRRKVNSRNRS